MIIDQSEIDALLKEADELAAEAERARPAPAPASGQPVGGARATANAFNASHLPDELRRLLRIRVPVIVRLAKRRMQIATLRRLSLGTIIEFDRPSEGPLDVMINNQPIALGEAVKVNEYFGLRLQQIRSVANRIRAMG